ncbi:MAG: homoserine dehydrogenase [Candidatus Omnitrophica bacterium]|nr:homoserine dehydrogenase [Candidatus Omnitrophota bacterium]
MIARIGIIGFGTVGEAVVRSLKKYSALIRRRTGLRIEIKSVCDSRPAARKTASSLSVPVTARWEKVVEDPEIDTVVELIGGVEPARTLILNSLLNGKKVVTANKALLAAHGRHLFGVAEESGLPIGFEAAVCGAIPLIKSISEGLVSCEVDRLYGILNGTTNYILDKMGTERIQFTAALREAQRKGLAEKVPVLDISGKDALHKLCILSYLCFGTWPEHEKLVTEGIEDLSLLDILYAEELSYKVKLLAIAKKEGKSLDLRVHPTLVPVDHPLAKVSAAYNAAYCFTRPAGELLFYGEGAGGTPTSSAIISDIVNVNVDQRKAIRKEEKMKLRTVRDIQTRYYIRFMAVDRPGVLAAVSRILSSYKISIASVTQKEKQERSLVPIVMLTHEAREQAVRNALREIGNLDVIKKTPQALRIEDV